MVGRERELPALEDLLDPTAPSLKALLFEGVPGIGKTTVWQAGVDLARERGLCVLECRPAQAEAKLAFASLADLLGPVVDDALPALPEPQRLALEVALLRVTAPSRGGGSRAIGAATCSVLRACAETDLLVVAIDDVQWLDRSSAAALAFALRRVGDRPVRLLLTQRLDAARNGLELDEETVERMRLEPLTLAGIYHVLRTRLDHVFARPVLQRIAAASGGNPLFALELGREILRAGAPQLDPQLPVPDDLRKLLTDRVRRLPPKAQEAVLVASALATPTAAVVGEEALADAEAAEIIRIDADGRIAFTHPLFPAAVYGSTPHAERRALHLRLAELVASDEERARHLALAAASPDELVAGTVAAAARSAYVRGATLAAGELAELAAELTPPGPAAHRRRLELAEYLVRGGDPARARSIAPMLLDEAHDRASRAEALLLLSEIAEWFEGGAAATELCEEGIRNADDAVLCLRLHTRASRACDHDTERKLAHAQAALELLETAKPAAALQASVLLAAVEAKFNAGLGIDMELVGKARELELADDDLAHSDAPPSDRLLANIATLADDFEPARAFYAAERRRATDAGDEGLLARTLSRTAILEVSAGRFDDAEEVLTELATAVERTGQAVVRHWQLVLTARLHACRGRLAEARTAATEAQTLATALGSAWDRALSLGVLGFVELCDGEHEAAVRHLEEVDAFYRRAKIGEPRLLRHQPDHVEALIGLGELPRARSTLERLEAQRTPIEKPWVEAVAARCRGLLLEAEGDTAGAEAFLQQSVALHEQVANPFELARTLLGLGRAQRRAKSRRAARASFTRAIGIFDELQAPFWAARADTELRRIPIRRGASGELTPTEKRVAELAAAGLTNREVAQALFVSPKTVAAHVARVYSKLGVSSRAELGARMAQRRTEPAPKT